MVDLGSGMAQDASLLVFTLPETFRFMREPTCLIDKPIIEQAFVLSIQNEIRRVYEKEQRKS